MGNNISRPALKERRLALLRRKLGLMTKKDKIERLINLTLINDEERLRKFAAKANLSKNDLAVYYKKLSDLLDQFNTGVPGNDFRTDKALLLAKKIESSSATESNGLSDNLEPKIPTIYGDPATQKKFEQFCKTKSEMGQQLKNSPRQDMTQRSMVSGDGNSPTPHVRSQHHADLSVGPANPSGQSTDMLPAKPKRATAFTISFDDDPGFKSGPTKKPPARLGPTFRNGRSLKSTRPKTTRQSKDFAPVADQQPLHTSTPTECRVRADTPSPYSPVPRLRLSVSPDEEGLFPAPVGTCRSSSSDESLPIHTKPTSRTVGKIGTGLLTRRKVPPNTKPALKQKTVAAHHDTLDTGKETAHKSKEKSNDRPMEERKTAKETTERKTNAEEELNVEKSVEKEEKKGLFERCMDKIKNKLNSPNKVIKVRPATPDNKVQNITVVTESKVTTRRPLRRKAVTKRVVPQPDLKPDKGIVFPREFEGLSVHNKSYYVEQFMRSELFKQRCERKKKGSSVWMNGLSKFQLWVVEHEGTDAIDAVLNPLPKSDAKPKVKCWRGDTPDC